MMWMFALVPFSLQALVILVDEFYFHHRRGLPKWERIGHPMDTFSLLICLVVTLWLPFEQSSFWIYAALAVISCLMVTKDEFIHKEHCPGAEHWLHALLFILHPLTLILTAIIWAVVDGAAVPAWIAYWLDDITALKSFLVMQTSVIGCFFFYQAIFWNVFAKDRPVSKC